MQEVLYLLYNVIEFFLEFKKKDKNMAKFIITPGSNLSGEIKVFGAKNAAIKEIAAACLSSGETVLKNVPDILDIQKIAGILEKMGVKFTRYGHQLKIDTTNLRAGNPDPKLVGAIRASIILVGPLLARFGSLKIPHPGGCAIGSRPIDLHIAAFRKLGVKVEEKENYYFFEKTIENSDKTPVEIHFPKISVGATENILLFASLLEREITLQNVATEPEVLNLIDFLLKSGVKISLKNRTLKILGQKELKSVECRVIPDRIEAGTFAILAAATGSNLKITGICPEHLGALLDKFRQMNIPFEKGNDFLYIKKPAEVKAVDVETSEYPGFPTDLEPPMGVLLTQAKGKSVILENIFENRLGYLSELQKMGAQIKILGGQKAEIYGPTPLSGAKIESLDLRAGATLIIAALCAKTPSEIKNAENIDRGYEKIEERLKKIGAKIQRVI